MAMGRPTKYTETTVQQTREYISEPEKYGDVVPTVAGLSIILGVVPSTIYKWAEEKQDFSDTFGLLKVQQERMLIAGGLRNDMNSNIVKLMLGNYGYGEKHQVEHSGSVVLRFDGDDAKL